MKQFRQAAIVELVMREAIHSQELLRKHLKRKGFDATQATLSRDIKEHGLSSVRRTVLISERMQCECGASVRAKRHSAPLLAT